MAFVIFKHEFDFLKKHYQSLPRTDLRYAIEKFPEELREDFLKGRV
ncbi:MAG: DNA alkylation repair protein [Cyclobacterium sp.]|nr:DNA alkylation repair protein [Cyclobacterium sp.]